MGLFGRSEPVSEPAPTAIDLAAEDKEKDAGAYLEHAGTATTDVNAHSHYIDPAMERRVVRKIDMRLIPLVTAMCKSISTTCPRLYNANQRRSAFLPRQIQHWQC